MFRPNLQSEEGQRAFEVALQSDAAPLPWDGVFDDEKIVVIDQNGNDVLFIMVGADRARAMRLARTVINAVNVAGGYLSVESALT